VQNHGTDPSTRFGLLRERVEAMKAIWTSDEASYTGRHVSFDRIWSWPKPVQSPHPPVLVGGNADKTLDRVVAYGDEWLPNRIGSDDDMIARFTDLQERAARAGRGPIPVTLYGTPRDPARIERLAAAGVHRFVLWLPSAPRDVIEPMLDERAQLMAAVAELLGD
jgi:Luciferase-like monooxygenase